MYVHLKTKQNCLAEILGINILETESKGYRRLGFKLLL